MSKPLSHGNTSECKKKAPVSRLGKAKRATSRKSTTASAAAGQVGTETIHHPIFSPLIDSLPDPPFSASFKDGLNRFVQAVGGAFGSLFPDANDTSQRLSRRR